MTRSGDQDYDIILFGATGFSGALVAEYLLPYCTGSLALSQSINDRPVADDGTHMQKNTTSARTSPVRLAIAGRNKKALESLADTHLAAFAGIGLIQADVKDKLSIDAMVSRGKVIISCVGPYSLYGSTVVEACVRLGKHYVDITGETPFVRQCIDLHHKKAQSSGILVVPCCGYDSVPLDMGVYALNQESNKRFSAPVQYAHLFIEGAGTISGGTLRSMLELVGDENARSSFSDPYVLNPRSSSIPALKAPGDPARDEDYEPWRWGTFYSPFVNAWCIPSVMAGINSRVVRRTGALLALEAQQNPRSVSPTGKQSKSLMSRISGTSGTRPSYGPVNSLVYREFMQVPKVPYVPGLLIGLFMLLALGLGVIVAAISFTRRLVLKYVLPKPGSSLSGNTPPKNGKVYLRCIGQTAGGELSEVRLKYDKGPYALTALCVAESALSLVAAHRGLATLPCKGGVVTPAVAFGDVLLERLRNASCPFVSARLSSSSDAAALRLE